eukprot:COSAG02_NODE_22146_length_762_cov_0.625943_1_plen_79_part_10
MWACRRAYHGADIECVGARSACPQLSPGHLGVWLRIRIIASFALRSGRSARVLQKTRIGAATSGWFGSTHTVRVTAFGR